MRLKSKIRKLYLVYNLAEEGNEPPGQRTLSSERLGTMGYGICAGIAACLERGTLDPSLSCPKRINFLTFWLSFFGPYLVMAPKGDHLLVPADKFFEGCLMRLVARLWMDEIIFQKAWNDYIFPCKYQQTMV